MRWQQQPYYLALLASASWAPAAVAVRIPNMPTGLFRGLQTVNCPKPCSILGPDPANWTHIHRPELLQTCDGTFLFDMNVQNSVSSNPNHVMRVCTAASNETAIARRSTDVNSVDARDAMGVRPKRLTIENSCGATTQAETVSLRLNSGGNTSVLGDASVAAQSLSDYLSNGAFCGSTILFSRAGNAIVGMYAGSEIDKTSAATLAHSFSQKAQDGQISSLELCSSTGPSSLTFGAIAAELHDLATVQNAVKAWTNAACFNNNTSATPASTTIESVEIDILVPLKGKGSGSSPVSNGTTHSNTTITAANATALLTSRKPRDKLRARADTCSYVTVVTGDSCASLATECGITANELAEYNPSSTLCSTLQPGQAICCGPGNPPDLAPQENADGTCYVYTIQAGDGCSAIAETYHITVDDLSTFNNNKTWAWAGCASIQPGQYICLSNGTAPLPAPVSNAECGPTVPGTVAPTNGTSIAALNPCPLNACCDAWGFCGTTIEFCDASTADTGSPGTHAVGSNGCISNCGMDIVNNNTALPDTLIRIGYFEGFNMNRSCLNMDVSQISTTAYSAIHFAFGTITSDFNIAIDEVSQDQFAEFTQISGPKKVLSLGGWTFSTDPSTYMIFREGVTAANRGTLAANIAIFLTQNNLDGIDLDWEYPGEPDIQGIPAGSPDDGANYLAFLQLLREYLGTGTESPTISVALPASYWYLRGFPVADMAKYVDYFMYMTYDLHGQWDYGNANAQDGCPGGNCLRSHVNITETYNALAMVTKAGVQAIQLRMGVSNYGRSFRMTNAGCTGPDCTYTGAYDVSNAFPGECTDTAGYIADAEIYDIINSGTQGWEVFSTYYDEGSGSDILIYGNSLTEADWVAYLSGDGTQAKRLVWSVSYSIGGTFDWAIDLEQFYALPGANTSDPNLYPNVDLTCPASGMPSSLQDLVNDLGSINQICWDTYAVSILDDALYTTIQSYNDVNNGYDNAFGYYVQWVKDNINPSLESYMDLDTGKGNQYFDCAWNYAGNGHSGSGPCPPSEKFWDSGSELNDWTITYTLTDSSGFFAAILNDIGIEQDWVKFDTYQNIVGCTDYNVGGGVNPCIGGVQTRNNFPMQADNVVVSNPKDVFTAAQSNITNLQTRVLSAYGQIGLGMYNNVTADDVVTGIGMPIFMLQDVVSSMAQIKQIGNNVAAQEKKDLILTILGAVLMVIPFVGEGVGALFGGVAMISRIAALIGEAGYAALSVEDIISDPSSAPWVILSLLGGELGNFVGKEDEEIFSEAAQARRELSAADLEQFSQDFKDSDSLIQKITNTDSCKV